MGYEMRLKSGIVALVVIGISGCANVRQPLPPIAISSAFDAEQAKKVLGDGKNSIEGNAFLVRNDGVVVTCAGKGVGLTPVTAYADERIKAIYGNNDEGIDRVGPFSQIKKFTPDEPLYYKYGRSTKCDSDGRFKFSSIPDGDYYVTTTVLWMAGNSYQGGFLMKRVSLRGGKVQSIIMS